jgi:glycosyltransferase involved in cell wall biosynthesis
MSSSANMKPAHTPHIIRDQRLRAAVDYCEAGHRNQTVFVVPFAISAEDALALHEHDCCASMVLRNPDPKVTAHSSYLWLGCFNGDNVSWQLPGTLGPFIFVGPPALLTQAMLHQVATTGARSIVCEIRPRHFADVPLFRFRLWQIGEQFVQRVSNLPAQSAMRGLVSAARRVPGMRTVWHKVFRRGGPAGKVPLWETAQGPVSSDHLDLAFFRELLNRAQTSARENGYQPVPSRILLVNAGLAAGGAERQVVNTLAGLKARGYTDSGLLGEYLHRSPEVDFYVPHVQAAGIMADPVSTSIRIAEQGFASVGPLLGELLAQMPGAMAEEILNLVLDFRTRRPAVVHAWQDSTSIKAGIAALIAGVPSIVLGSRNVTPVNFGYYQKYMRCAYQALAQISEIVFLNNSDAGATDYCRWLELPRERYKVVRNGVDFSTFKRIDNDEARAYRSALGIPAEAPVVGSVFRFWAEKRPMLWLEAARDIAHRVGDAHFLLIGEGPMRGEMEAFIRATGLKGRLHLPGARCDVATPMSAMDLFMLTSEFEGTPNVVLEAQWLGLPVVATDAGGTREAIAKGETGWCCPADSSIIADRVSGLLTDTPAREQVRQSGPRFIDERFGIEQMINQTLTLYELPAQAKSR